MLIEKLKGDKYDNIISYINQRLQDETYLDYFKTTKNICYTPLIVVRICERGLHIIEYQRDLIIQMKTNSRPEYSGSYMINYIRNREQLYDQYVKNHYFDCNIFCDEKFIDHLKNHKVYLTTQFSYINGYFEEYLLVYFTDEFDEYDFDENLNFLLFASPTKEKKNNYKSNCIIS